MPVVFHFHEEQNQCRVVTYMISGVPRNFVGKGGGGFQQIQLRTEDRENGALGAVAT